MKDKRWIGMPLCFIDNRITRPYIGGKLLHEWRNMPPVEDGHACEELLVSSIGAIVKGQAEGYAISRTIAQQGGDLLSDLIKEDPIAMLGEAYQKYNPNQTSVLARVGDTIVRLVLQCHPTKEDAQRYFHSQIGKSEAWYIARTRVVNGEQPCVYAGFKPHVTRDLWCSLFKKQDVDGMVACLHKLPVKQGDVILIPAGMPHAVGPGCLFLEIHECSDITIRVQREVNGITLTDEEMFNGLDAERGLGLFDYTTYDEAEIKKAVIMKDRLIQSTATYEVHEHITYQETEAFAMNSVVLNGSYKLEPFEGHRILTSIDQDVELTCEAGKLTLSQGHGAFIPANCKHLIITGTQAKVMIGYPSNIHNQKED